MGRSPGCGTLAYILHLVSSWFLWPYRFPPSFSDGAPGFDRDHPKYNLARVVLPYLGAVIVFAIIFLSMYGRPWMSQFEPCKARERECWDILFPWLFYGVAIIAYVYCLSGLGSSIVFGRSRTGWKLSLGVIWIILGVVFLLGFVASPLTLWHFGISIVVSFTLVWILLSIFLLGKGRTL